MARFCFEQNLGLWYSFYLLRYWKLTKLQIITTMSIIVIVIINVTTYSGKPKCDNLFSTSLLNEVQREVLCAS